MRVKKQRRHMPLFDLAAPSWTALPSTTKQLVVEALSQLLHDAIDQEPEPTTTTSTETKEHVHVS